MQTLPTRYSMTLHYVCRCLIDDIQVMVELASLIIILLKLSLCNQRDLCTIPHALYTVITYTVVCFPWHPQVLPNLRFLLFNNSNIMTAAALAANFTLSCPAFTVQKM